VESGGGGREGKEMDSSEASRENNCRGLLRR